MVFIVILLSLYSRLNHLVKDLLIMKKFIFLFFVSCLSISNVNAHSGGTDSMGCHTDHKTGLRHCH